MSHNLLRPSPGKTVAGDAKARRLAVLPQRNITVAAMELRVHVLAEQKAEGCQRVLFVRPRAV